MTPAQVMKEMKSDEFTWISFHNSMHAKRFAARMITRGYWFCVTRRDDERVFVFSSAIDLTSKVLFDLDYIMA